MNHDKRFRPSRCPHTVKKPQWLIDKVESLAVRHGEQKWLQSCARVKRGLPRWDWKDHDQVLFKNCTSLEDCIEQQMIEYDSCHDKVQVYPTIVS